MTPRRVRGSAATAPALLLASALIAGGGPAQAQEAQVEAPYTVVDPAPREPEFAWTVDSVTASLGLPPLREVELPPGFREVRLWKGFGNVHPFRFVRVVDTPDGARGEAWMWGILRDAPPVELPLPPTSRLKLHGCHVVMRRSGNTVCPVRFREAPPWGRLMARMDSIGAWSVPDSAIGDPDVIVLDGVTVVVEARTEGRYQTYTSHQNPVTGGLDPMLRELARLARPTGPSDSAEAAPALRSAAVRQVFAAERDPRAGARCLSDALHGLARPSRDLLARARDGLGPGGDALVPADACTGVDSAGATFRGPGGTDAQLFGVGEPIWLGTDLARLFVAVRYEGSWSRHTCIVHRTPAGWAPDCREDSRGGD